MRKKYPQRHFVSHIAEHIIGIFAVLAIAVGAAYQRDGAFAQTLILPSIDSTLSSDTSLVQSSTGEITPVSFAVTPAPVTDCSGAQPLTRVLFAISPLSGGTFVVTSNSGTSDMKLSWGEYPLPNGTYVWRGIPHTGFIGGDSDSGTFELRGECGSTVSTAGEVTTVTSGGGTVYPTESTAIPTSTVIELIPPHSSSFVPAILSRPSMKIFSDNIPVTSATPAFDNEEIEFRIEEADARKISLVAVSRETGKATQIGNAVVDDLLSTKSTDIWVFFWNGENISDGTYNMSAHVLRNDGTTIDTLPVSIVIQHAKDTTPPAFTNDDASRDDTTVATSLSVSLPEKEDILLRVNETSACTNALECATFCESEADEVCASYAQYDAYPNDEGARSLAEGVSPERVFLMLSEPRRRPQELPEIVTTVEEFIAYCAELANEEVCTKALARNDLATAESLEERKAALRRESEEQERIWGERVGARGFVDSDHDGITDYDEINMYHTDPEDEDTDQDGFIDGEELLARTNPNGNADNDARLKAEDGSLSPDEEIRLENPLISGTVESTLLAVSSVSALSVGVDDAGIATVKELRLTGVSPPNSYVTLFVYSDPIVVTVKADASGSWTYTLDRELPDGTHHVISTITDGGGRIIAKSTPLPFVKEASAVTLGAELLPVSAEAPTFFGNASLYGMIAIVIALLGVTFSVLGFVVHNKKEAVLSHHNT